MEKYLIAQKMQIVMDADQTAVRIMMYVRIKMFDCKRSDTLL